MPENLTIDKSILVQAMAWQDNKPLAEPELSQIYVVID